MQQPFACNLPISFRFLRHLFIKIELTAFADNYSSSNAIYPNSILVPCFMFNNFM